MLILFWPFLNYQLLPQLPSSEGLDLAFVPLRVPVVLAAFGALRPVLDIGSETPFGHGVLGVAAIVLVQPASEDFDEARSSHRKVCFA